MVAAFSKFADRYRESVYRLAAIPAEGGEPKWLPEILPRGSHIVDSGVDAGPVWSPDGSRIAIANQGTLKVVEVDAQGNPVGPLRQVADRRRPCAVVDERFADRFSTWRLTS